MDDGRGPGVEKVKAFQDLSAPAPQYLGFHYFETLQIAVGRRGKHITRHIIFKIHFLQNTIAHTIKIVCTISDFISTHVFSVPDVMSSVTKTIHFFPLRGDSQKS